MFSPVLLRLSVSCALCCFTHLCWLSAQINCEWQEYFTHFLVSGFLDYPNNHSSLFPFKILPLARVIKPQLSGCKESSSTSSGLWFILLAPSLFSYCVQENVEMSGAKYWFSPGWVILVIPMLKMYTLLIHSTMRCFGSKCSSSGDFMCCCFSEALVLYCFEGFLWFGTQWKSNFTKNNPLGIS